MCRFKQILQECMQNRLYRKREKISYITGMAKSYKNLGSIEAILNTNVPSAEKYFNLSLTHFIKTGDEAEIAWAWKSLGYTKWVLCKFPEAIAAFEKAVQLFEKIPDSTNLAETYDMMSMTAETGGQYEKALRYSLKSAEFTGRGDSILNGDFYSMMGDYETALEYYRKSRSKGKGWQWKYLAIGIAFHRLKQYDSADHYYKLFADYANTENPGQLSKFYAFMGELHLDLKRYDSALIYLNDALSSHKKAKDNYQVMRVLAIISQRL